MADESPQDEDEDIAFPAISPAPVLIALLNLVHALVIVKFFVRRRVLNANAARAVDREAASSARDTFALAARRLASTGGARLTINSAVFGREAARRAYNTLALAARRLNPTGGTRLAINSVVERAWGAKQPEDVGRS